MKLLLFIGLSFFYFDQVILMSTDRTEGGNISDELLESKMVRNIEEFFVKYSRNAAK